MRCIILRKSLLSLLVLILFSYFASAQKVLVNVYLQQKITRLKSDTIYYDTSRLLSWKDFQGVPDNHHYGGAITASGYAFNSDIKMEGKIIYMNIGVYVYFNKKQSWKKPSIISEYHLLHEQHHFDITRIAAEKFIVAVSKAKFTRDNYTQVLNTLFDQSYNECSRLQQQYDRETAHSINKEEQLRWNELISAMVKKL